MTPKDAALLALKRARDEAETPEGNLLVVGALITTALRQVELIQELSRPRREKKTKATA
jgi:hypothetical protein